jgi:glutamyl-tRNA synthetase
MVFMKELSKEALAYALKNAIEFGKADVGRVLPKLFQHGLLKEEIKKIMPMLNEVIKKVNKMKNEEREREFEGVKGLVKEHEEKEKGLPEIDVKELDAVITRMAPEPSKYNHLGHALTFLLNYLYAQKYNGKCLLRFEDTNPEKAKKEYVDAMKEDVLDYLGIKADSVRFVSNDMKLLYDYAEKLVKSKNAYVCFCDRDKMQKLRHEGKECECREFPLKVQVQRWKEFLKGKYKEGEATLRIKGDMQSLNHVMRDSVIFRRIDAEHYKYGKRYKIWPMYDFYNPIEDSLMGVTLILRTNEFDMRVELQDHIKKLLSLKKQKIVQYGRINVIDFTTQGREIRELVEKGELIGWDDPRLITLRALKRRGIVKEAIYELTNSVGLTKHPVNLDFDMIAAINRKIIDPIADRYSFVSDAVKLDIMDQPVIKKVEIPIHPNKSIMKKVKVGDIFISKEDYNNFKGKEIRLLHLYNIKLADKNKATCTSIDNKDIQKINWVSDGVETRILMSDGTWKSGIAEKNITKLRVGAIIQFERFGFCRFDGKKKGVYEFWFAHK